MKPTISVVIPVHNKERHALRSLRSAMGQSLSPDEILVVDDASTDRSIELMRSIADHRVRFMRREEPGPGGYAARNLAIEEATSEWIAFLDADDSWEADHIGALQATIESATPETGCIFSGYRRREPDGAVLTDWYSKAGRAPGVRTSDEMLDDWTRSGTQLWMGAVAVRKSILIEAGMFPAGLCRRGGDRVLWLKTIVRTKSAYTGKITATYHCDSDNMVTQNEVFSIDLLKRTAVDEILAAGTSTARRLKKLLNREIYVLCRKAWRRGQPIRHADFKEFHAQESPGKYALIQLMRAAPIPIPQSMRAQIRSFRARQREKRVERYRRGAASA